MEGGLNRQAVSVSKSLDRRRVADIIGRGGIIDANAYPRLMQTDYRLGDNAVSVGIAA